MADTVGSVQYDVRLNLNKLRGDINASDALIERSSKNQASNIDSQSEKGSKSYAKLGFAAGAAAAVITKGLDLAIQAVTSSIGSAVSRVDTLNNAPKVFQNLGFSAEDSAKATKRLDQGIRGLPTSLDNATSALTAIAAASGKSIDYATDLTLAFNNMALAGGKGPMEAQRALTQFTQALGRGKFQMQDFNTLAEVMPAQLNQVAKSLLGADANTRTLGEALSDGSITMDQFNDEIIKLDKEGGSNFSSFSKQAKDATSGIGTVIENAKTAITRSIAGIITAIGSENITNAITAVGKAFEGAANLVTDFITALKDGPSGVGTMGTAIRNAQPLLDTYKATWETLGRFWSNYLVPTLRSIWEGIGRLWTIIQPVYLAILSYLIPAFKQLWNTISTDLLPVIKELWPQISETLKWVALLGAGLLAFTAGTFLLTMYAIVKVVTFVIEAFALMMRVQHQLNENARENWSKIGSIIGAVLGAIGSAIEWITGKIGSLGTAMQRLADKVPKFTTSGNLPGFSSGGFTGRGGANQVAGVVHRGEYVLPKEMVNQSTGMPKAGGSTINITINPQGIMARSRQDLREITKDMIQSLNEELSAQHKPLIGAA